MTTDWLFEAGRKGSVKGDLKHHALL